MTDVAARRRGFFVPVLAGLVAALLIASAAWFVAGRLVGRVGEAAQHVPEGASEVFRIDVREPILREPIRKYVLDALSRAWFAKDPLRTMVYPGRLERLQRSIGMDLRAAVQEVVVAFGEKPTDWVILLGGRFVSTGVVEGLDKVLQEEGRAWTLSSEQRTLVAPDGLTVAQAADGVLILASTADWARKAQRRGEVASRLGLDVESSAAFVTRASSLREVGAGPIVTRIPAVAALRDVEGVRGSLTLDTPITLEVTLQYGGDARGSDHLRDLEALRPLVVASRSLVPAAAWLGPQALEQARMVAGPDRTVLLELRWDSHQIDRTIGSAANIVSLLVAKAAGEG